jgi:hypothetical protein
VVAITWPLNTAPGKSAQDGAGRLINVFPEQRQNGQGTVWRRAPGATKFTDIYPSVPAMTGTATVGFVGGQPLDGLDNVYSALGTRTLLASYSGALIRLRRSSDNTEQDFSASATGWVSISEILTFIGSGGTGYVCKIYDQSGNSRHAVQVAASVQPTINIGGNNASISFDKSRLHEMSITNANAFTNGQGAVSLVAVRKYNVAGVSSERLIHIAIGAGNYQSIRAGMVVTAGSLVRALGRRTDADASDGPTGLTNTLGWEREFGWSPRQRRMLRFRLRARSAQRMPCPPL